MIEVKVYTDIASNKDGVWMQMFGLDEPFSADRVRNLFDNNTDENEFTFNIHCDGGSVSEGLAIYDIMRGSGKTMFCNIDGSCHSMAICVLLAAPKENRTANQNARALIHRVQGGMTDCSNADELKNIAAEMEREENAILDIYTDRTKTARETLKQLMFDGKILNAQELLNYGFISKINNYNTNKKNSIVMSKTKKEVINAGESFLTKLKNFFNETPDTVNFDHTDADGNVLFSTEAEDDTLEVGMAATPDGTFPLPDGRSVTIAAGVITEITEPQQTDNEKKIAELEQTITEQNALLTEAQTVITDLKNQLSSNFQVSNRNKNIDGKRTLNGGKTVDDYKNEMNENRNKWKGTK